MESLIGWKSMTNEDELSLGGTASLPEEEEAGLARGLAFRPFARLWIHRVSGSVVHGELSVVRPSSVWPDWFGDEV